MDFGIGFWELCFTALIALLVLGPDKLPGAARTIGLYLGKARRMMHTVKAEVERELRVDELRQNILKHNPAEELNNLVRDTREELNTFRQEADGITPAAADTSPDAVATRPETRDQP